MNKKILIAATCASAALSLCACGEKKIYDEACTLYVQDELVAAKDMFSSIEEYEDSAEKIQEIETRQAYLEAKDLLENGDYTAAIEAFEELGDYEDSLDLIADAQKQLATDEANQLLVEENFEGACQAFSELGDEEMVNECIYEEAQKYYEDGYLDEAYDKYCDVIDYKDSIDRLVEIRNGKDGLREYFVDDYGTKYTINGYNAYSDEMAVSLSFHRDDLISPSDTTYGFSNEMDKEWRLMGRHVRLVIDGEEFYGAITGDEGGPYCDIEGECGEKKRWFCWLHFPVTQTDLDNCESAVLMYDDVKVEDLVGVRMLPASAEEREEVYERACVYYASQNYFKAKQMLDRLYRYEESDTLLEILNIYFDSLVHEEMGDELKLLEDAARMQNLIDECTVAKEM